MKIIKKEIFVAYEGDEMRGDANMRAAGVAVYFASPDDAARIAAAMSSRDAQILAAGGKEKWLQDCDAAEEGIEPSWGKSWKNGLRQIAVKIEEGEPASGWVALAPKVAINKPLWEKEEEECDS